jgi:acetyl esterase/lipase
VLVAGWSAGANIAAVTCQLARDRGGPQIAGQLLVCPVTDCRFDRPSYADNAVGYFLTRSLMFWFWDIYCSPADRTDPRASPLRGNLRNLPRRSWRPASSIRCVTRASNMPRRSLPPVSRSSNCRRAATSTHPDDGGRGDHRRQRTVKMAKPCAVLPGCPGNWKRSARTPRRSR